MDTAKKPGKAATDAEKFISKLLADRKTPAVVPLAPDEITRLYSEIEKATIPLLEALSTLSDQPQHIDREGAPPNEAPLGSIELHFSEAQVASIPFLLKCYTRLGIAIRQLASDRTFGRDRGVAQSALRVLVDQSCRNVASIHNASEERLRVFGSQRLKFPVLTTLPVVERTIDAQLRRAGVGADHIGVHGRSRAKPDMFREAAEHFILLLDVQLEINYGISLYAGIAKWRPEEREEFWAELSPQLRRKYLPAFLASAVPDEAKTSSGALDAEGDTGKDTWMEVLLPLVNKHQRPKRDLVKGYQSSKNRSPEVRLRPESKRIDRVKEVVLDRVKTALGLRQIKSTEVYQS